MTSYGIGEWFWAMFELTPTWPNKWSILASELGQTMTRYNFIWAKWVIMSNVRTDSNLLFLCLILVCHFKLWIYYTSTICEPPTWDVPNTDHISQLWYYIVGVWDKTTYTLHRSPQVTTILSLYYSQHIYIFNMLLYWDLRDNSPNDHT